MNTIYQWIKLKEGWIVAKVGKSIFLRTGDLCPYGFHNILKWGPTLSEPTEIPYKQQIQRSPVVEECIVERAEDSKEVKIYPKFDPP